MRSSVRTALKKLRKGILIECCFKINMGEKIKEKDSLSREISIALEPIKQCAALLGRKLA